MLALLRKFILITVIASLSLPVGAANGDIYSIYNNSPFFAENDTLCEAGGGIDDALVTGDNVKDAFVYLRDQIKKDTNSPNSAVQAAGLVGNFIAESGVNPKSDNPAASGGGGGIAQWEGNRWTALLNFAKKQTPPEWDDINVQLKFVMHELRGSEAGAYADLKKQTNPTAAAISVQDKYERPDPNPKTIHTDRRIAGAVKVFNLYGNSAPSSGGTGGGSTADVCDTGSGGNADVNVDGYTFPVAPQRKSVNGGVKYLSALPCNQSNCHHDNTPAFDLGRRGSEDASAGAAVYAIHDGTIKMMKIYKNISGCYQLQLEGNDTWWYWYGHIASPTVKNGQKVKVGDQVAVIGPRKCTGNGSLPHLHIDRGCNHQPGGSDDCRDQGFVPLINKLYGALPQ